ncbi:acyl-ACP--UDP-N-acetylglucosamine O-acyltransferase [Rickettsiella endosymbiont of Dermanyssus gallinae]|uniref:acyl-ACP--UDP-N-acetylglucosamine O-acyltransferase n=1 Tax=Rickettsiella endosymbiont of Dermanyssus gallinae TaxID=2856608 RepID=UPI001C530608|nr:acyl-ACP--UDP-N-acetylglucosamine O-acyltransferase [Rickettsiella endosymbiont of Dermanyssus gallinae]
MIDPQAKIDPKAKLGENVSVGPWTIIGPDVEIGEGTIIGSHVVLKGPTHIGKANKIYPFASIGDDPQDKKYQGEKTHLEIGDHNVIREYCTINRGTTQDKGLTKIGDHNLFMVGSHIAHDCLIGDHTIFVNNVALAGHVTVGDYAILGAYSAVHQFCKVGEYSFIAAGSMVRQNVLPYVLVEGGHDARVCGLNKEGLRRNGFSDETINALRAAYKFIFRKNLTVQQALEELESSIADYPQVKQMASTLKNSDRGIIR